MKLFVFRHKREEDGPLRRIFCVVAENATQAYAFMQMHNPERYQPEQWWLEGEWEKGQVMEYIG